MITVDVHLIMCKRVFINFWFATLMQPSAECIWECKVAEVFWWSFLSGLWFSTRDSSISWMVALLSAATSFVQDIYWYECQKHLPCKSNKFYKSKLQIKCESSCTPKPFHNWMIETQKRRWDGCDHMSTSATVLLSQSTKLLIELTISR